jgi:hypothetical protein
MVEVRAFPTLYKHREPHTQRMHTWSMPGHTTSSLHRPNVGLLHLQRTYAFASKPRSQNPGLTGHGDHDDVSKPGPRSNQRGRGK